ncbi:DUF3768 domain-containing protein [Rhizobium brockwellii]|uniref:DUF3768 domain-containing protein n=1 Tax=Rhizobium brockwellii TaxID=3019932 RepID=UPI003F94AF0F
MSPAALRIADLNDLLRATFLTGKVVATEGIAALDDAQRSQVIKAVQSFRHFTPDNDPYGEHDFGSIEIDGVGRVFWKIDYYDPDYRYHSEDAADPTKTRRVLTIMLASEY